MERLIHILAGIAILYLIYALGIKNWDYTSEEKRTAIKQDIRQSGLSVRFYFLPTSRLVLWMLLSGGLFSFYWFLKQWHAIYAGYKNTSGKTLRFSPLIRTLFFPFSCYLFATLVNRTCVYMRKIPALPAWFWGTLAWTGAAVAAFPWLAPWWRVTGGFVFILALSTWQKHINSLPKELPPLPVKPGEFIWVLCADCIWVGILLWQLH